MIPDLESRTVALNRKPIREQGDFVLVWLQQAIRGHDNPVIDAGISLANARGVSVLIYHGVREDYPHASARLHRFLLGASRDMALTAAKRNLRCVQYVQRPRKEEKGLVYKLAERAIAVFTDDYFTFVGASQAKRFAARASLRVYAVDASRLVPSRTLPAGLTTTPAFRRAHTAVRETYENAPRDLTCDAPKHRGAVPFTPDRLDRMSDSDLDALVARCRIDQTLPSSIEYPATLRAAHERLSALTGRILARYKWTRNTPSLPESTSQLSPYLHFGVIGPREVVEAVRKADVHASARWKFLDEMLTWREYAHYLMLQQIVTPRYESLPAKARKTLEAHEDDPRDLLTIDQLIHGESPDETWNAAQRQWLATGWMHNNLRMYWGKKIVEWTPDAQTAWATACYLNDRLSLDGRDPATYASLHWCLGAGRPGYREIPIYGWVAPKSDRAMRKRAGMIEWLAASSTRQAPRVETNSAESVMENQYF